MGLRLYHVNDNAFDTIDTEAKAYWLGFLFADGCVIHNNLLLELSCVDYGHIEKFLNFLCSDYPIQPTKKKCVSVCITSKHMVECLKDYGCVERKSLILKFPAIDLAMEKHFIRGYFDGNGSITKVTTQGRYDVSFSGTMEFLSAIPTSLGIPSNIIFKNNSKTANFKLKYGGKAKAKLVMDTFYNNATIFLDRKKKRYDELCEALVSLRV